MRSTYDVRRPQAHHHRAHPAPRISGARSRRIHKEGVFGFDSYGGVCAFALAFFSLALLFVTVQGYEPTGTAALFYPRIEISDQTASPLTASLAVAHAASGGPLTYLNEEYGFTFAYPSSWSVFTEGTGISGYGDSEPFILLEYGHISELPVGCDTPECLASWRAFLDKLNETMWGATVNFARDGVPTRDGMVIAVGGGNALVTEGDTSHDAPPLHPTYTLEFAKGDLWLVLSVHDASLDCGKDCGGILSRFSFPMKSGEARYAAWNDFVDIVRSFEFLPANG